MSQIESQALKGIEEKAEKIAELVIDTDTDLRGLLFNQVSKHLGGDTQFFTASLFLKMAEDYGLPQFD